MTEIDEIKLTAYFDKMKLTVFHQYQLCIEIINTAKRSCQ